MGKPRSRYEAAHSRWAGVGPYYAMFPAEFADQVIAKHTREGDTVLDPFAGRGTAVFSAASQGRRGIGVEVNPVGWVYARAKLAPADKESVSARVEELARSARNYRDAAEELPLFFHRCFTRRVNEFLLAAREAPALWLLVYSCRARVLQGVGFGGPSAPGAPPGAALGGC